MSIRRSICRYAALALLSLGFAAASAGPLRADPPHAPRPQANAGRAVHHHHGARQVGKASIYARKFAGRKMANGARMNPRGGNAASKSLPLGTAARVTNLETGRSAIVTIEDRGPYVRGRIIDLSPATAQEIGLTREQGLASVEVAALPAGE